ncbi:MAG: NAD-dependent epimerase/dehydratase family protein [Anaerolineae bacterium]|nr:NAD-dependent epimerase/dehydratase family protein [Anaerolineae bacterium]
MRVLVTGGAGFIGSHVVDTIVGAGHHVAIVDDLSTGKRANLNPKATFYQADIRDENALAPIFAQEQPEAVCHQAALANVREAMAQPVRYASVNVLGSLTLLEMCRQYGVQRFVYASTGGAVYGEPQSLPVNEEHPINPLDPYGASKHHVEHYLHLYRHNYGLRYTVLRYANVYGPRQDPFGEAGVVAIFTNKLLAGETPTINGTGEQERDFVYVGDVARANLLALTGAEGIFNVGTGVATTINQVYQGLREATGYQGPVNYGPAKAGEVYRIYLDVGKAAKELNWTPQVPWVEGLRCTVASFRK